MKRLEPLNAAERFIAAYYPDCESALLAGSVVRKEATETSDLDLVIFDSSIRSSFRESLTEYGWKIEVFVHSLDSYKEIFLNDYKSAKPSMPRMVAEGVVLKDKGVLASIKKEAERLLENGPEQWTEDIIHTKRYFITDTLDDFIGCTDRRETLFAANTLAELLSEFVLRANRRWIGSSKWIFRSLRDYDPELAEQFVKAFDEYYINGNKDEVIDLSDQILKPYGGRYFEGFSIGKV